MYIQSAMDSAPVGQKLEQFLLGMRNLVMHLGTM